MVGIRFQIICICLLAVGLGPLARAGGPPPSYSALPPGVQKRVRHVVPVHRGKNNHFWSYRSWDDRLNCYTYFDPLQRCFFYWSAADNCYYPVPRRALHVTPVKR
jgi:hypothetical protein